MTKNEMLTVLQWIDAEFYTVTAKMTDDDRKNRAAHFWSELGAYPFPAVMEAVKRISRRGFPPRTGEILAGVGERPEHPGERSFRIKADPAGRMFYELNFGEGSASGPIEGGEAFGMSPVEALKWRWWTDRSDLNTRIYDAAAFYGAKSEKGHKYASAMVKALYNAPAGHERDYLSILAEAEAEQAVDLEIENSL